MSQEKLDGNDITLILMTSIGAVGACFAALLQCVLRSRCQRINCCGAECVRDVLPAQQATLDTTELARVAQ